MSLVKAAAGWDLTIEWDDFRWSVGIAAAAR